MRTSLRILVTAAAAGSLLVPAGPASAETAATDDAAGDVWEVKFGEEDNPTWDPAGSVVNTDIVSTVVDHLPRRISFTTTYTLWGGLSAVARHTRRRMAKKARRSAGRRPCQRA